MCNFESKLQQQGSEIAVLKANLEAEKKRRVNQEAYSRRMNLRLLNIPEDIANVRDHVSIFNNASQLVDDRDIDQIHRLGKKKM